jgi:hypothetical protein
MCLLTTLSTFYPSFMFLFQLRDAVMLSVIARLPGTGYLASSVSDPDSISSVDPDPDPGGQM